MRAFFRVINDAKTKSKIALISLLLSRKKI
jgi:hypothetical protein